MMGALSCNNHVNYVTIYMYWLTFKSYCTNINVTLFLHIDKTEWLKLTILNSVHPYQYALK